MSSYERRRPEAVAAAGASSFIFPEAGIPKPEAESLKSLSFAANSNKIGKCTKSFESLGTSYWRRLYLVGPQTSKFPKQGKIIVKLSEHRYVSGYFIWVKRFF